MAALIYRYTIIYLTNYLLWSLTLFLIFFSIINDTKINFSMNQLPKIYIYFFRLNSSKCNYLIKEWALSGFWMLTAKWFYRETKLRSLQRKILFSLWFDTSLGKFPPSLKREYYQFWKIWLMKKYLILICIPLNAGKLDYFQIFGLFIVHILQILFMFLLWYGSLTLVCPSAFHLYICISRTLAICSHTS